MIYNQFREAGFRVFGLRGVDKDGNCGCGNPKCTAYYKHPIVSNWQHTPDWSDEQIEVMEMSGQFATGYGILVNGLIVIDVDARNGGVDSFDRLSKDIPEISGAGLVVNTGSGNGSKHLFFKAPEGVALLQHLNDYKGIDFKTSGFVVGAGSQHASGNKYELAIGSPDDIGDAPQSLVELLKRPELSRTEFNGSFVDISTNDIKEMLSNIDPDIEHDAWCKIGMSIHHSLGGAGLELWDEWSSNGEKYTGFSELEKRWHSFGKSANPATYGTLRYYAEQSGWKQPVTFVSDVVFDYDDPLDTKGVDLQRPPDFVGKLAAWINDQCRYPRERLSVAAALTAIGNIAGMRYTDDRDGVTANLFAFCVAGSGSGKEAVLQSMVKIMASAGMQAACHGAIKSEQEILRNLCRHQAAFYTLDELGYVLKKMTEAKDSYLSGVIGTLMSAYSKADGHLLLTGDSKEEVRLSLQREVKQLHAQLEDKPDERVERRLADATKALESVDAGLVNPFLSLIGFSTPVTFDAVVTPEQATNGFIGRALLFVERETNPRAKRRFKKKPMPSEMDMTIKQLGNGGRFDSLPTRVEYLGDKKEIPTNDDAADLLDKALDYFEDYGEEQKSHSGLEAIVRRAYEQVSKISLILAIPSGLRTAEHVRWAFALVKEDIDSKISLAYANDNEDSKENGDKALMLRIQSLIDRDTGATVAYLKHRMRRYKREDIETSLLKMKAVGLVEMRSHTHGGTKKTIEKWYGL